MVVEARSVLFFSGGNRSTAMRGWLRTVLGEDVEALFNEDVGVDGDESEGERQDVVAGTNFQEIANRFLALGRGVVSVVSGQQSSTEEGNDGGQTYEALLLFTIELAQQVSLWALGAVCRGRH